MTLDEKLTHILAILGALVPLLSATASLINHIVRKLTDAGKEPSKALLTAGSILNFASVNLDKAVQFGKMAKGGAQAAPHTIEAKPSAPPTEPPKA